jgi:secreted trypsin-like serine protease
MSRTSRRTVLPLVAILCGLVAGASPARAIIGGSPAPPDRWPWMAALLNSSVDDVAWAQYCGGVVIGRRRVLTAAHCVISAKPSDIDVLLGRARLSLTDGHRLGVDAIGVYPGFMSGRQPSLDAAVVKLSAPAGVPPVELARPGQEAAFAPGTEAWTMGWGALHARRTPGKHVFFADRLRELAMPVQGDDACEGVFGIGFPGFPYRPEWVLCAGDAGGSAGTCNGDSGGPLVVRSRDGWLDVGVLSGGDACASRGYYDLFARVDAISDWALRPDMVMQPEPARPPHVVGELIEGRRIRCAHGRWRGGVERFTYEWTRAGDDRQRVLGRRATYRVTRRDVRAGVRCSVTAANEGGRFTAVADARPA